MQFYPGDTLNGDHSNYWAPNAACVRGLLRDAGFAATAEDVSGARGIFSARRTLDPTVAYHRRLEKTTVAQARPPQTPLLAGAGDAAPAEGRAAVELSSVRQVLARSESELAGAREYIASLEAEVERKEADLVAAYARASELEAGAGRTGPGPHEREGATDHARPSTLLARRLRRAAAARRAR